MTQKEAYREVESFAKLQGWELIPDQITGKRYAVCVMTPDNSIKRQLSCYLKPVDLIIFIDGYNTGIQHHTCNAKKE